MQMTRIQVEVNGKTLLKGSLEHAIDVDCSTWSLNGEKLSLLLSKKTEASWSTLLKESAESAVSAGVKRLRFSDFDDEDISQESAGTNRLRSSDLDKNDTTKESTTHSMEKRTFARQYFCFTRIVG